MSHGLVTDRRISRDQLLSYRERPVAVIGAASAEGVAVLRLLVTLGFSDVTVHDQRERDVLRKAFRTTHGAYSRVEQDAIWTELKPLLEGGRFGAADYLGGLEEAALVVLPQGWYLTEANRAGIVAGVSAEARVTSMVELYFALHRGPIAAITGTNGKSTTVGLAEHLLEVGGVAHRSAGNERSNRQFLPEVDAVPSGTWALLETSNRQLLQLERSPQVAAITALTPDHLEEHDGFAGYRDTKARLFVHQGTQDVAIANADDAGALEVAERSPAAGAG
ncbi:MAG: UDP-N-acetylmuramoyl-L-alanyl-D-glutamate synthetase, partial [Thermoleophilia bacterium]|nr:UDP-N-acetylmuramoyl-L-alanyl-D-glutamate synthetase [Thermoleophilia bacterium]